MATDSSYEVYEEKPPRGLIGRFFETAGQLLGLLYGWVYSNMQVKKVEGQARSLGAIILRFYLFWGWLFVDKDLVKQPFDVQFRVRLERMGPTYIKLGQVLSLREDILPKALTDELKNLLSELPAVPYVRYKALIEDDLGRPISEMFALIDETPLGSASLAQSHRAELLTGEVVVLKVLKPGVRQTINTDTKLLRFFGWILNLFIPRYQPKQLINEFSRYTLREVDLRFEANNAEVFTANFVDEPDVRFPRIYRAFSNRDVLCMEYFAGRRPDAETAAQSPLAEREKVVDLGVSAIIQMIFQDGFFHADLHPGNLVIFEDGAVGFIDLGMVGRFDSNLQKRMLYYFYSLAQGDAANAARYLTSIAEASKGSDAEGFRRAVEELNNRWLRTPTFSEFSLGQLVLASIALAGRYRIRYPGEIILMVKALITVEGVGNQLIPDINVTEISSKHIRKILIHQFNLVNIFKDGVLIIPELLDVLQRAPLVLNQGLTFLEANFKTKQQSPSNDALGTIFAVGLLIAAAIMAVGDISPLIWGGLIFIAFSVAGIELIRR